MELHSPLPVHAHGENRCSPNSSSPPSTWPGGTGDHGRHCLGLSALGPHLWHMHEMAAGWSCGFHSGGKLGSCSCWKAGVWLCKNELFLGSVFLGEGLCFVHVNVEHHFGSDKLWHGWWHMQVTSRAGMGRHTSMLKSVYLYSEPRPPFLPWSQGREMPAGTCSGSRGTKHRPPTFSLCLSWLKRP